MSLSQKYNLLRKTVGLQLVSTKTQKKKYYGVHVFIVFYTFCRDLFLGIGMYNADLQLNEKGYYIAVMLLVIVGSILTQKVIRDNSEDDEIIAEQQRRIERNESAN
jgi:uncharacterized membrane protein YiaA